MNIAFSTNSLEKIFNTERKLVTEYGAEIAKKIKRRMAVLHAADCLEQVPVKPPERRHELSGKLKGAFAVDLKPPHRLIFKPQQNPVPLKDDGGINLRKVTAITILRVEDYH